MASKRSQVRNNLQKITAVQPVARVIDTYAPAAPPAPRSQSKLNIVEDLVGFFEAKTKSAEAKRKEEQELLEAKQKEQVTTAFMEDPDKFAKDLAQGKFSNLTSPAQLLASEHAGTRLARQYNIVLREEYDKAGLSDSTDANAFFEFENSMRTKFIKENGDAFTKAGVATGFSKSFRQYIQNLDSSHTASATKNLKAKHEQGFKDVIYTTIDAALANQTSPQDFGQKIRLGQNDAKLGYSFDNKTANSLTTDALIEYSQDTQLSFTQRRNALKLANFIQTTPGSNLAGTKESAFKIGKALAAIDDDEEKQTDRETKVYRDKKMKVQDSLTSKMMDALRNEPNSLLDNVFTADDKAEAKEYYPSFLKDFDSLQNFFQGEQTEQLASSELIAMRQEISTFTSRADALVKLNSYVSTNRLKKDATAFGTLLADIRTIKDGAEAKPRPAFTKDPYFQARYRLLGGVITDTGEFTSTGTLPEPVNLRLQDFVNNFITTYLSEEYAGMTETQKNKKVLDLFNTSKDIAN